MLDDLQRELGGEIVVRGEIHRGPMTVTFAGTESRPGRDVIIHVIPPEAAAGARDRTQRLLRAARATAKLRHPRVVPVYRVAAGDRLCWYVTRPDEGETLAALLEREGPLASDRVPALVAQIAAGLTCAHEQGLVHGDLTPSSVVIGPDGAAAVRDFGIARAAETAGVASSVYYRAPELDPPVDAQGPGGDIQLSAITGMSAAADQYALGIIAWEMLTGSLPFMGRDADAIRREHRDTPLPPLGASRPDAPPAVSTVLERALAKRPADRFPSVAKFAQSLRAAAEGRPSHASPARPITRKSTDSVLLPPGVDSPAGDRAPSIRAPRRPVLLGVLGGATALTLLSLMIWRSSADATLSTSELQRLEAASRTFEAPAAAPRIDPAPAAAEPTPPDSAAATDPPEAETPAPAPRAAAPKPASRRAPSPPPRSAREDRRAAADERRRVAGEGTAWITVGTSLPAAIFINSASVPMNPVRNWPVPSGAVFLRFEVMDNANGVWIRDTVVNLAAGDTLNLRRIRLVHP